MRRAVEITVEHRHTIPDSSGVSRTARTSHAVGTVRSGRIYTEEEYPPRWVGIGNNERLHLLISEFRILPSWMILLHVIDEDYLARSPDGAPGLCLVQTPRMRTYDEPSQVARWSTSRGHSLPMPLGTTAAGDFSKTGWKVKPPSMPGIRGRWPRLLTRPRRPDGKRRVGGSVETDVTRRAAGWCDGLQQEDCARKVDFPIRWAGKKL